MINWGYLASLDFGIAWEFRQALLWGLGVTLLYYVLGAVLGSGLALGVTLAARSGLRPLRWLVVGFVELFRNTPLLVQLIWIHYALPSFTGVRMSAFASGLLALTLNVSAYVSEIFRAGVEAVPKGQWEACRALGLGGVATWRLVILPQAVRIVLPPYASMMISLLKGTAILSILSIPELMRATTRISTHTARPVEILTVAAAIYFVFGLVTARLFALLERRYVLRTR